MQTRQPLRNRPAARSLGCAAAALALSAAALAPASAQQPVQRMQPGLWEHNVSLKSQSGHIEAAIAQAQKALAGLPPAQRKQMEDMMAAQGLGINAGAKGHSMRVCVTPEQAALDSFPQQDGCTQKVQRVDANTMNVSFSCKGNANTPPTSGEGTVHFQGPKAYTGQFRINTAANGKAEQINMDQSGKWVSDTCGAIKPLKIPAPASR